MPTHILYHSRVNGVNLTEMIIKKIKNTWSDNPDWCFILTGYIFFSHLKIAFQFALHPLQRIVDRFHMPI